MINYFSETLPSDEDQDFEMTTIQTPFHHIERDALARLPHSQLHEIDTWLAENEIMPYWRRDQDCNLAIGFTRPSDAVMFSLAWEGRMEPSSFGRLIHAAFLWRRS